MYRIYLRDASVICGRVDFDADDDAAAMLSAELLADACSDVCVGFELWQGLRLVRQWRKLSPLPPVPELSEKAQAVVVETEEAIKDSKFAIASSRRLLERLARFKLPQPAGSGRAA